MDIKIQDKWLREFLDTNAKPNDIAKCLSLCGPSVERVEETKYGTVYHIEVTGNRTDSASVYGIAREAAAILPRFGFKANLKELDKPKLNLNKKVDYLETIINHKLCPRFTTVLINNVEIRKSPQEIEDKLFASGSRPINNIVDISNLIMFELGQPVHTFDYDKIKDSLMMLRESQKGEKVITLDGIERTLSGGDIVIEDGSGKIIDLCGIMGGKLSAVDENTRNVLLFIQTYNPVYIRRTSMTLAHRTDAAVLFEKGLDSEMVPYALYRGIELFKSLTGGEPKNVVLDIYPEPYKDKTIKVNPLKVCDIVGTEIKTSEMVSILNSLQIHSSFDGKVVKAEIPSFRSKDVDIEEDLIEEISRIYGYQNMPSEVMKTAIPMEKRNAIFGFEEKLKDIIKSFGGYELYTISLVSSNEVTGNAYKLVNPLGHDTEYMRTSLLPSLQKAISENLSIKDELTLFEISSVYLPVKNDLPNEKTMLAAIFANTEYRVFKGYVESFLTQLHIDYNFELSEKAEFLPGKYLEIKSNNKQIGIMGTLKGGNNYFEFPLLDLFNLHLEVGTYKPVPKYPAQVEDMTIEFPEKTKLGDVIRFAKGLNKEIVDFILKDTYENSFTFRITYQNEDMTLKNKDVEKLRNVVKDNLSKKFGATIK
jgi:phenylalanyl-tRNA synthetase beta chain